MAYDEDLAERIRALVSDQLGLTEQRMFGGLAFLVGGHMAVAASAQGGLLVRVDPDETSRLVATTAARRMEMHGRELDGWLRISRADVEDDGELARWVALGTAYAGSLPPKS